MTSEEPLPSTSQEKVLVPETPATPGVSAEPVREVPPQKEEVAKKPVVVFKVAVGQDAARGLAESNKLRPFGGGGLFSRVRSEDIDVINVALYYTPYVKQVAEYKLDYYRKNFYTIAIDSIVSEVIIMGNTIKPEATGPKREAPRGPILLGTSPGSHPEGTIKLEADERIIGEQKATVVVDRFGKEVPLSVIPTAAKDENPEAVLAEAKDRAVQPMGLEGYATNLLRLKIAQRPVDAARVNSETFNIAETTVNYVPIYNVLLRNKKTGDTKTLLIDAITSKPLEG